MVAAEAAVVGGLMAERTALSAFALAGALLGAFTVGLWRGARAGLMVPCRCLGASATAGSGLPIVRNVLLLAVVAVGLWATGPGGGGDLPPLAGVPAEPDLRLVPSAAAGVRFGGRPLAGRPLPGRGGGDRTGGDGGVRPTARPAGADRGGPGRGGTRRVRGVTAFPALFVVEHTGELSWTGRWAHSVPPSGAARVAA
ncbi:MauE/DoxX family redox-associated membrane protein [Micromonospora echinospora]|uniref:MauE/DoxX family redox-associated membrane protein n=1 Tax=Micromonospora echinospora TaxID=1877 RepID=UPI00366D91A9